MTSVSEAPRPSPDQIEAFRRLSADERFGWYCRMLELCFALSDEPTRESWRKHKTPAPVGGAARTDPTVDK